MRLNKFLSICGVASRRKADELIKSGVISVNGTVIYNLGININEKKDIVICQGNKIELNNLKYYYKLNKPKGYICSNSDEKGRKTIFELLPNNIKLFSVGRLDYNTEGLIFITNDGDFAESISHPKYNIEKEYIVKIEGKISESELAVLRSGVVVNKIKMPKAKVKAILYDGKITKLSVIITQGQNRQIRKMFEGIGKNIIFLKRIRIGNVLLGGLQRGKFKELNDKEIKSFLNFN